MERPETLRRARAGGRVFSIAPGTPFLKELAAALVDGRLVEGFRPADDPLLLPKASIYLPNRRAARAFSSEIISALGARAALLPNIRTLGDSDEDELWFLQAPGEGAELPPAAGTLERRLQLATMVRGWADALSRATREVFEDEDIVIPSSMAEALALAGDLARLLDQIETEEVEWPAIAALAGPEHAKWWELTLTFLKIVSEFWPRHLEESGRLDPSIRRRLMIDLRTRRIGQETREGPVIAAGSTGSIPATARFLAAIATRPDCAVVLPGVDFELAEPVWRELAEDRGGEPQLSTHPQHGLARLLAIMKVPREAIERLGRPAMRLETRCRALALAMLPAPATGSWHRTATDGAPDDPGEKIAVVEAPGMRQEALAIAIAMREALETDARTAALTTPDRALARRVAAELRRFGIAVDDSAGTPLAETPAGRFAELLVKAATGPRDAVGLAAFLKEAARGQSPTDGGRAHQFELAVLRDALSVPVPGELETALADARRRAASDRHAPAPVSRMTDEDWEATLAFARHVDLACRPLTQLRTGGPVRLAEAIPAVRESIGLVLGDPAGERLAQMRGGRELIRLFDDFEALEDSRIPVAPGELAAVLRVLCREIVVRDIRFAHPRLHLWGPLEARLQHVDLMILGGLNEGTWPAPARNDAFLNRPMKGELGLSVPERRIGQAAHDFSQLAMAPEVILTRSLKVENAPAVASRWLQRFMVVAGKPANDAMRARGERLLRLAEAIDADGKRGGRARRPCPAPPMELRPTGLSITEIETWIRDPYAIYARHVLDLRPLPPLGRDPDPALRGSVYHEALARFVRECPDLGDPVIALENLHRIAGKVIEEQKLPVEVALNWRRQFEEIGRLFVEWEAARNGEVLRRATEISGNVEVGGTGFRLRGRADRIDILRDGTVAILDYKTGMQPSARQARTLSPQLSLEGKMAELGAFGPELALPAGQLAYVRLRADDELRVDTVSSAKDGESARELSDRAWVGLLGLIAAYQRPQRGYLSRYAVMREGEVGGDYDHLARVREWSIGEADDNGDG